MRIAVAGGTGLVGRYVVERLKGAGGTSVILTRSAGIDITTGPGRTARAMADGALLPTDDGPRGHVTFAERLTDLSAATQ